MEKKPSKNKLSNSYIKYSSIGFQMIGAILIGLFLGKFLDKQFGTEPILVAILTLFGVAAGLYIALKDFIKK